MEGQPTPASGGGEEEAGAKAVEVPIGTPEPAPEPVPHDEAPTTSKTLTPETTEEQARASSRASSRAPTEPHMLAGPLEDTGVIGHVPRYAAPNVSSMLPTYTNSGQEFIHRTFNVGNYDLLKHLPDSIKEQQVAAMRATRMEATRQFLMPALAQPLLRSKPGNQQDLFSTFEYIPSRFSLADELASKERVESEAKRMAVGGKEFTPSGHVEMSKHMEYTPGVPYPYLAGAYEGMDEARMAQRWIDEAGAIDSKPWVHTGPQKVGDRPTRQVAWDMMGNLQKWIVKDWEGIDVSMFENDQDCWVIKVVLSTVDSEQGLVAYMNVFVRCNELVNEYKLNKVVEFWGNLPGDGSIYFVLRPPWVKPDRISTYYSLYPEEKDWRTMLAVTELERTRPPKKESDFPAHLQDPPSALGYTSRLDWGVNFLTGTPAAKALSKMKESGP